MANWHNLPWVEVVKQLNSDSNDGLNNEQAKLILKLNERAKGNAQKESELKLVKEKSRIWFVSELWFWVLIFMIIGFIAALQYVYLGISIILAATNIYLFYKNKRYISDFESELKKITNTTALVVRQGRTMKIPSKELVRGDIILLNKGSIAPADIRLIESDGLKVKESLVTGEILEVEKYETRMEEKELSLSEIKNIIFKSSQVVEGSGKGIVVTPEGETEVERNIKAFFAEHKDIRDKASDGLYSLVNITSAVLFIAMVCICLIYNKNNTIFKLLGNISRVLLFSNIFFIPLCHFGASKIMLKLQKKYGIKESTLSAFYKITQVEALCIDKVTGIADIAMDTQIIFTNDKLMDITIEFDRDDENLKRILNMASASTYSGVVLKSTDNNFQIMEKSFSEFGKKYFEDNAENSSSMKSRVLIPYDKERGIETSLIKLENNFRVYVKGHVDSLLSKCKYIMKNGIEKEIIQEDIEKIKEEDLNMCQNQLNTLAVAYRNFTYEPSISENVESNLVFVGIIGFTDSVRDSAFQALQRLRTLGIKPIIFTNEPKLTAIKLCEKLFRCGSTESVLSGVEIDNMNDDEFSKTLEKTYIFSRINSLQKYRVMWALKQKDVKTALISSQFSDIAALNNSYVGIAEGQKNLIMKSISDVYIEDGKIENFANMLNYGFTIFKSLRKIIGLYIFFIGIQMVVYLGETAIGTDLLPTNIMVFLFNLLLFLIIFIIFSMGSITHYKIVEIKEKLDNKLYLNYTDCLKEAFISIFPGAAVIMFYYLIDLGQYRTVSNFMFLGILETILILFYYKKY